VFESLSLSPSAQHALLPSCPSWMNYVNEATVFLKQL
jgi:hypothetical protein